MTGIQYIKKWMHAFMIFNAQQMQDLILMDA